MAAVTAHNERRSQCRIRLLVFFLCASCRFITSSFAEMAFRGSTSDSMTVSPSKVLTGVSRASDREISRSESGTDIPCSHFEIVCRTTFSLTASSCWESPFDVRIAFMFSLSIWDGLLPSVLCHNYIESGPLPQATYVNISGKWPFLFHDLRLAAVHTQKK